MQSGNSGEQRPGEYRVYTVHCTVHCFTVYMDDDPDDMPKGETGP